MSETSIEWADAVWNPTTGCSKVSEGCRNCYAERLWPRLKAMGNKVYKDRNFNDVACHPERLGQPLRWVKSRKIFVNSMSDLFHDQVSDEFIARVWWVMGQCAGYLDPSRYRGHTFMILTKRPERMKDWLEGWQDLETRKRWIESFGEMFDWASGPRYWPDVLDNVWLGVSVENQDATDERIPLLLETPAAVRFISAEPLLGPIDLTNIKFDGDILDSLGGCYYSTDGSGSYLSWESLDWVIVGGESGPNARPMHPDWVRSLRDQCQAAGTKFFFKQWGEWAEVSFNKPPHGQFGCWGGCYDSREFNYGVGYNPNAYPGTINMQRIGKKRSGRMLDGRTWVEFPGVPT